MGGGIRVLNCGRGGVRLLSDVTNDNSQIKKSSLLQTVLLSFPNLLNYILEQKVSSTTSPPNTPPITGIVPARNTF